jgi:thiol-disulfide isomerase/thioredoxin
MMIPRRDFLERGLVLAAGVASGAALLNAQIKTPKVAPDLSITLTSGERVLLSQFRGKVVVIEFLLTTCPHCVRCSETMQKVYAELGPVFQPLGAAVDPVDLTDARARLPGYLKRSGAKFPIGWTEHEMAYNWLEAHPETGPVYFPQLAFIDRKGIIQAYHPGTEETFFRDEEKNILQVVNGLLKGQAAGAARKK